MKQVKLLLLIIGIILSVNSEGQMVGADAPDFEANILGGGTFKLSDHSGKVIFIFLFGNGCPYCEDAVPDIQSQIYNVYHVNSDFVAIGMDTWPNSDAGLVRDFQELTGISFPLAVEAHFMESLYGTQYDRLLVIDKEGKLTYKGSKHAYSEIDGAIEAIEAALQGVTGLSDKNAGMDLKVYPNPATDRLFINVEEKTRIVGNIRITDLSGRVILDIPAQDLLLSGISVEYLQNGVYFYQVESESATYSGKLIISR